jgi:hypothetical protein
MEKLKNKKYRILILILTLPLVCFIQTPKKGNLTFKIINYRKCYNWDDDISLFVKNTSNKPLWFSIGVETIDNKKWIEVNLDISNPDPAVEVAVSYALLRPNEEKKITYNIKAQHIPSRRKHGVSALTRLFLKFGRKPAHNEGKMTTQEYRLIW